MPGVKCDGIPDGAGKVLKSETRKAPVTREPSSMPATRLVKAPRVLKLLEKDVHKYSPPPGMKYSLKC